MKKVWLGVGIGCGALVLLAVVGMGVTAFWAKSKLEGVAEVGQQVQDQEEQLRKLDARYAFRAPPEGEVLALQAERLGAYLAIREAALPVYARFEEDAKALDKQKGQPTGFGDAMKAAGMLAKLTTETRATFIEGLERQHMSPREFNAITQALYSTMVGVGAMQAHEAMRQGSAEVDEALEEVDAKLEDEALDAQARAALEAQRDALQAQRDALDASAHGAQAPSPAQQAVLTANAKLLEQHKERIEKAANPAFDFFLLGAGMAQAQE